MAHLQLPGIYSMCQSSLQKQQLLANQEEHKVWIQVALTEVLQLYLKHLPKDGFSSLNAT